MSVAMSDGKSDPMSVMPRIARGLPGVAVVAAFGLGIAGRADLPMPNAFIATCAGLLPAGLVIIDAARARFGLPCGAG